MEKDTLPEGSLPSLYLVIMFIALIEETIFRLFPLAFLFPIWGSNLALWIIVIASSLAFGILHITNQKPEGARIIFTTPQILSGLINAYIFLAFGFFGVVLVHFIFDAVLFTFLWADYRIKRTKHG